MASNSKRLKLCSNIEDRISGLPDALLCHILSFLVTREAVKTSVLSHRWKNVWASVPILDFDEQKYRMDFVDRTLSQDSQPRYKPDWFARFVNLVLLLRCPGDIHRFRLVTNEMADVSLIYPWISTAIRRNVVELALTVGTPTDPYFGTPTDPHFEIPKSLFMCSTLVRLKLWLRRNISVMTPSSNCFPSLKFLHVTVLYPDSESMEKLFSRCFPVLEDLIIDRQLSDTTAFNLDISAPQLKRLQIELKVYKFGMISAANYFVNYVCQMIINVGAPNLEELDICFDALVSFSLKNAKCLRKAKIGFFNVKELENHDCFLGLADRIRQIFTGICDAKYLTVGAPLLTALDIGYQHLLPTFNNLKYLELQLHTCRCLQSLATVLKISPHLEHLKILRKRKQMYANENNYFDDVDEHELELGWDAPGSVPVCLISQLKTVSLWELKRCPNEVKVAKYLVKHGKALNRVNIHAPFSENKDIKSRSPIALWSKFSKFYRGSKPCKVQFQTIV